MAFPRKLVGELMDRPDADPVELDQALRYIRFVNRRLGGSEGLIRHLRAWRADLPRNRPITMLDIGTGTADIPIAVHEWAAGHSLRFETTAIDLHETTLRFAQAHVGDRPDIKVVRANALMLDRQFEARTFDIVHMGMFLHHLPQSEVLIVLRHAHRLARFGVVWNDLLRSRASAIVLRAMLIGQTPMVRHDATVSVAAGFTHEESLGLARAAGWPNPHYRAGPMHYRFTVSSRVDKA